jgi:voltage-gated potassium channel
MTMGPSSAAAPFVEAAMADVPTPRRLIVVVLMRSSAVVMGTLLVYGLMPVREETALVVGIGAVLGLVALGVVFAQQLARISRADRPVVVAIEALALVVTMFVALFASLYVSMSASDPGAFTQPVTKVAGIYFAVTVLGTVGFGDISAVTDPARIAVTIQMVLDLILIGVAVKVLGTSARRAVEAKVAERLAAAADGAVPPHVAMEQIVDGAVARAAEPADGSSSRTTHEEG